MMRIPRISTTGLVVVCLLAVSCTSSDRLACLPLDPTGWSQSEPNQLVGFWKDSLAANEEAAVVVGAVEGRVSAYWSEDGLHWESASGLPDFECCGSDPATAGGPGGFVAVSTAVEWSFAGGSGSTEPYSYQPIVVFSADGITWEQVDPKSLPTPSQFLWLSDVYAGPAGFLVTGHEGGFGSPSPSEWSLPTLFAWSSPDGLNWTRSNLPEGLGLGFAVVATDDGWAALSPFPRLWASIDGLAWEETTPEDMPPLLSYALTDDNASFGRASPTALDGDTWLLIEGEQGTDSDGQAWGWVSTDRGSTWNRDPIGSTAAYSRWETNDIAATPIGLLVTGHHDHLHYTADGATWHACTTARGDGGPGDFEEVEMLDDTLILYDRDHSVFYTWNDPGRSA